MQPDTPALPFVVEVECYAGYRGEETPRRFSLAGVAIEIAEVVDRWLAPDHRYFRVQDSRGDFYVLRADTASARWELTFFQRAGRANAPSAHTE
jgi:hypothetical protein